MKDWGIRHTVGRWGRTYKTIHFDHNANQEGFMEIKLELTENLEKFRENIESTIKPFIKITAQENKNISLWKSKFGGFPYFPKGMDYPKDTNGQPMYLLAQINFGETPKLEGFPEKGILQFYLSGNIDLWSSMWNRKVVNQNFYRVLYFPEITNKRRNLETRFKFLPKSRVVPYDFQSALTFTLKFAPLSVDDYQFAQKIISKESNLEFILSPDYLEILDEYRNLFPSNGHKLGGYPFFTQNDPRVFDEYKDEDLILLFQMDTDQEAGLMWGDNGVANFFISKAYLKKLDFSKVLYNMDCY
jgi:uncharacterized protein YwqG